MKTTNMKVLVTGGAGFIGSHLVDAFMLRGADLTIFDNLASGTLRNVDRWLNNPCFTFTKGDLLNPSDLAKIKHVRYDFVFHLAANPEVRVGSVDPNFHFRQNLVATRNFLEYLRETGNNFTLIYTSTSTVYGEATKIPTPEDYAPLNPISIYGATKLACEALISAYAKTYDFKAVTYRLANVVGSRSKRGVIHDFLLKLMKNPKELEILGDGTQTKSYLHVSDCVKAMLLGMEKPEQQVEVYNVGSEDQMNVTEIAHVVIYELGLRNVKLNYTGGVDGGRGWVGDVKNMLLDTCKVKALGWKPKLDSREAVAKAVKELTVQPSISGFRL